MENPCFKINKNPNQIWKKMKNKTTFKAKLTYQIKYKLQLFQGEWSTHTTNPIDPKIWRQFTRIEEYSINFIFDVILTFKGRFWSILVVNHDEFCLNLIAIDSRTQENHDELKICLQNFLIASRLIKSWVYKGKNTIL